MGQEFYFKHYKVENGLSHNTVLSSLQDERGFLWFGTKDGLNRFDGYTFKVFHYDSENPQGLGGNFVESLHEYGGKLWIGTDNGLFSYDERFENFEAIEASLNFPVLDIDHDNNGNLWFVSGNSLVKYEVATKKTTRFDKKDFFQVEDITRTIDGGIWGANENFLFRYDNKTNAFKTIEIGSENKSMLPLRISKIFSLNTNTLLIGTQNHGVISFDISKEVSRKLLPDSEDPLYVRDFSLKNDDELWIATESGLYIYNLEKDTYQNLRKNYNDPYALSDNALYSLTLDDENGMWIGSYFGGINYYPKQYSRFDKYFPKTGENSISGKAVREIRKDDKGNLWIGTEDAGLNKFNPNTGKFTNYRPSGSGRTLSHYNIHAILPRGDKLWAGTFEHGLDIMDINTGKILKHYSEEDGHGLSSNFVFALYEDESGNIFAVTASGIQSYDFGTDAFTTLDAFDENTFFTAFLKDNKGIFWAGTYWDGLYNFNPNTNKKRVFKYDNDNPHSISSNGVNSIFQDSGGTIWITTESGLNRYRDDTKDFKTYSIKDGFPSNVFYSIIEGDDGILWISTSNGLVAFDPTSDEKRIFSKANGLLSDQFNYNSAFKDDNGTHYFGSVGGMVSFNPSNFSENTYQPPVFITGLQINNTEVGVSEKGSPLKESVTRTDKIELKPDQSSFSIDFAALGFTAPETTEYWYKLEGLDDDWIDLKKKNSISFTQLPAGNYTFKVKALNNNGIWSKESSPLKIEVLPVFWKSNWAYFLYAMLLALLIFIGFRMYHQRVKAKNVQRIRQLNNRKEKEIYEAKIEFFTNISHEIRTPLTLIKSPLEKIIRKMSELPEVSENLSIIEKNTNRLLDLVNQLLDFRKTENERVNLTFVDTNISELVLKTHERFSEAIEDKDVDFDLDLGKKDVHAFVDAEALRKILSNLFGNAIKYASKKVKVVLDSDEDKLKLIINNDGKLIPAHLKDKIFEPFYRVSGMENQSGTGIGLALARSLTEMHEGSLNLDTSNGAMNSFVLQLPIHQEREFMIRPSTVQKFDIETPVSEEEVVSNGRSSILLVEDSEELLDFLAQELKEDYLVFKATNGEDALKFLEEENIQLIVSDVMMPGIDGFTLCKKVKTNLEMSHIPVILLTSKSAMTAKLEGLESGADAYIEKPFSMKHLKVNVTNLIENRRHIMAHYASSPLAHIRSIANTKTDETFIEKLDDVIYENMADHDLNVETLAEIMHMSRSTLYRKIKDISNLSPNELINITRLKKSAELLKTGKYRIFEVAEIVGYNSATSFGRNFQKQFEMTPSEYMNSNSDF
ncbi:hybrid sensor histidine kinase/response regulator [Maribacter cobaltidurans]|uniref:histidine kinase n=2 Tax=Maribacter cobaltidurans TaxID=1178778 RepID=A0A223V2T5_9FLAO|nr:hybrid sensor histidine kinase/response regulator [Maribacter cobaltidurans]GGD66474.1 hybrid sensor histidine kinase/response regulator [Maribacter cobaltidurans]